MVLAVEADGAAYHSSQSARDRDRLRQQQLENLGWTFHRIWSTDWFRDPDAEVAKTRLAYAAVDIAQETGAPVLGLFGSPFHTDVGLRPVRRLLDLGRAEAALRAPDFGARLGVTRLSVDLAVQMNLWLRDHEVVLSE